MADHRVLFSIFLAVCVLCERCCHATGEYSSVNNNNNVLMGSRDPSNGSSAIGTTAPFYQTTNSTNSSDASDAPAAAAAGSDEVTRGQRIAVMAMLTLFSVFGTLGNGLVLYVFTRKNDKVTSTIFILALAWTDFFTCLVIIPFTTATLQLNWKLDVDLVCKLYMFFSTCVVPLSAFMMVTIAVDRYFSICHPFLHVVTPKRARIAVVCLFLFAFSLGTITACTHGVYTISEETITGYLDKNQVCRNDTFNPTSATTPTTTLSPNQSLASRHELGRRDLGSRSAPTEFNGGSSAALRSSEIVEVIINGQEELVACNFTVEKLASTGGMCSPNTIIFSASFTLVYQKIYISFFIISLLAVFTLYFFIYRSVVKRRAWRKKQKSWSHSPMSMTNAVTNKQPRGVKAGTTVGENMELVPKSSTVSSTRYSPTTTTTLVSCSEDNNPSTRADGGAGEASEDVNENKTTESSPTDVKDNGVNKEGAGDETKGDENGDSGPSKSSTLLKSALSSSPAMIRTPVVNLSSKPEDHHENGVETHLTAADKKTSRERRDFNFLANIRTAIMLFVVALVFIVSFLPAWLMATQLVTYQVVIFYMHYVYNASNPVIYAFMNQSFRKELKRVFQRGTHFLRRV